MGEHEVAIERVAQRTWDHSIAGGDIPLWTDLDDGTKRHWRGSLNVSMGVLGDAMDDLLDPLSAALVRLLNWISLKRSSSDPKEDEK